MIDVPKPAPPKQRLTVYVDGFNLYHGLHDWAGRRLLWLDLHVLAQSLRPLQRLTALKYFTAPVLDDPGAQSRQAHYIEGLTKLRPTVEVVQGRYERKPMECRDCGSTWTSYEEKETDVNIATRIVADAYAGSSDSIIIVSGDSDLAPAVRVARNANPRLFVAAAFPPERFSRELKDLMPSSFHIARSKINQAQLPDAFDAGGKTFQRPSRWC